MFYNGFEVFVFGNDWGGVELVEKLCLMELVGIGQMCGFSYFINVIEFFWFVFIFCFSFFVLFFLYSNFNGLFILKESLDFDLLDCFFFGFIEVIWEKIGFFEKMKEVNVVIR